MRIIVTGGSGFLGSHVADALSNEGHEVVVFDHKESPYVRPDQTMIVGDILNQEIVEQVVKKSAAIYHFAGIADIDEAAKNPIRTIETNVMGTMILLEAAKKANIQQFIFASSIYVYSNQGSFYRTAKQTCEKLIEDYHSIHNMPYTILRFGSLYGPRAGETNAVQCMIRSALNSKKMFYGGTGDEIREYIHVLDGAAAAVEVLDPSFEQQIVHLTGNERMTTRNMMEMIAEILGGNIEIKVNEGDITGHYFQTPYSYTPKIGRKLVRNLYIDIGLGLLELIEHNHQNGLK